ncbi:MAG: FAD-dependent oxidoreductase [Anaerolineae bacterium]
MTLHAVIIGAGSTGAAVAHDLTLRGYRVTVVERGEVACETTGRNHGLLHSGARYVLNDLPAARECAEDNALMRKLMPGILELNGGLFVALNEEDLSYKEAFLEACAQAGVPAEEIPVHEALRLEPNLNPRILAAVKVQDGVFDPFHFTLTFLATAKHHGARVHTYTEVVDLLWRGRSVSGVKVRDRRDGREYTIGSDLVVNAAGPWAGRIGAMAHVDIAVLPVAGTMVAVGRRWVRRVINRMCPPCDGGIIVPQRRNSVVGTTSWPVENPDYIPIPPEQVEAMLAAGEEFIPGFRSAPLRGISAAARPLLRESSQLVVADPGARGITRGFSCFNHAGDGAPGFFSIIGGKTTTSRLMAEVMGDVINEATGITAECRTREVPLLPYHAFYV